MKCRGAVTLSFVYSCYCYKFYDLSCGFGGNLLLTTTFYIPALSSWEFVMHHTIYIYILEWKHFCVFLLVFSVTKSWRHEIFRGLAFLPMEWVKLNPTKNKMTVNVSSFF